MIVNQPSTYLELQSITNDNIVLLTDYHGAPRPNKLKNKIIIYSMFGEYLRDRHIDNLLDDTSNYYIFLTCQDINQHIIDKYINCASFIFVNSGYNYYSKNLNRISKIEFNNLINASKSRYFLSLNNRASWPRLGLFYFFKKYNLIDKSFFSYINDANRATSTVQDMDKAINGVWYTHGLDIDLAKTQLPLYTGLDNFVNNDWGYGNIRYYQESFCSVVTETYNFEEFPFFTEKIFKPIAYGHPFLVHSNPGSLKALQNMGFKTFSNWWDESYDNLADHERFEKMLNVILEIASWPIEKINQVHQEMIPVLTYNYKHFTEVLPKLYNAEIINIKDKILSIINTRQ